MVAPASMTLILTALTPDFIVQVSDRRGVGRRFRRLDRDETRRFDGHARWGTSVSGRRPDASLQQAALLGHAPCGRRYRLDGLRQQAAGHCVGARLVKRGSEGSLRCMILTDPPLGAALGWPGPEEV